jgi:hypothetical protein
MNFNFKELYYLEIALECAIRTQYSQKSVGYDPDLMEDRKQVLELLDKVTDLIDTQLTQTQ